MGNLIFLVILLNVTYFILSYKLSLTIYQQKIFVCRFLKIGGVDNRINSISRFI